MGIFVQRPGHAQSFPIPLASTILSTIAMPSIHVFEIQATAPLAMGIWAQVTQIGLPVGADDESIDLQLALTVQRGYDSDTQVSSGIRGGNLALRGHCGWRAKMGWDQYGNGIYAEGQALTMNLRAFFMRFAEMAADEDLPASVRLVYRNLDTAEAYVVKPDRIRIGRNQDNPILWQWDLTFDIIRPIEPDPFLPNWMGAIDSAFDTYRSASLTAAGAIETLAVTAESVARVTGAAIDTLFSPLRDTAAVLRDLGEGLRSIYSVPVAAVQDGVDACYDLGQACRDMVAIVRGETETASIDPAADDDRDRWGDQFTIEQDCFDAAHSATEVVMAAFAAQEPGLAPPEVVRAGDDISTLPPRVGRTIEQIFSEMGVQGPLVDPEQVLPGSLWPGAPISLDATAPDGSPSGIAAQVVDETTIYGVNLRLYDGDLVPEQGGDPQDVQLVAGQPNLEQGLNITLQTVRGHNRVFPGLGIDAPIGEPNYMAPLVQARAMEAVLEDDRIKTVNLEETDISGDTVPVTMKITPWGAEGVAVYTSVG